MAAADYGSQKKKKFRLRYQQRVFAVDAEQAAVAIKVILLALDTGSPS
jgi:hypothetical protein